MVALGSKVGSVISVCSPGRVYEVGTDLCTRPQVLAQNSRLHEQCSDPKITGVSRDNGRIYKIPPAELEVEIERIPACCSIT